MANRRHDGPRVKNARFVTSVAAPDEAADGPPEVAFVGRSNVGKSSLLNALAGRKALARTSKTPGRTQRANLFDLRIGDTRVRLVDLPGYGHANAPKHVRAQFGPLIERWLLESEKLLMAAILIDLRRDTTDSMMNFLLWLQHHNIRIELVFTKADQVPKNRRGQRMRKIATSYEQARFHGTSSIEGLGIAELRARIAQLAREFDAAH